MDLLQTVRKEGSRGGVNFSWSDVQTSQHRENYLGHSLMAPVGRWQKNKDLGWYAKGDGDDAELTPEQIAEKAREKKREEMRKVKEAEEDAMAKALGLPVPDRSNANLEPLGLSAERQKEVNMALKAALGDEEKDKESGEKDEGVRSARRAGDERRRRERRRDRDEDDRRAEKPRRRSRSRSRSRDRDRKHRQRHHDRSRSRSRDRKRRDGSRERRRDDSRDRRRSDEYRRPSRNYDKRPRSRDRDRDQERRRQRSRSRSRSPYDSRRNRRDR